MKRLLAGHARFAVRHPRLIATALGLVTLLAALGLTRFSIESDLSALIPRDDPGVRLALELSREEGTRSMLLVVEGRHLEQDLPTLVERLQTSTTLEFVSAQRDAWLGEAQARGLGLASARVLNALNEALRPEARRAAIAASKRLLSQDPVAGRELVLRDPLGLRWILQEAMAEALPRGLDARTPYMLWRAEDRDASSDFDLALLLVRGGRDPFDVEYSVQLMDEIKAVMGTVDSLESWDALGGYDVAQRDSTRIRGDMTRSLSGSIPLLLLALMISTRSWVIPHLYVIPTLIAVVWALGLGGVIIGPLSPLAVSGAAILMGLGIDFCIHYVDRYREERREYPHGEALVRAHRGTGPGLLLGMLTTVGAFLSFSTASFPGAASFGMLLTLGLVSAFLLALNGLPLILGRVGPTAPAALNARTWERIQSHALGRSGRIVWYVGLIAALWGWGAAVTGGLRFDADPGFLRPVADRFEHRVVALEHELGASPLGLRVLVKEGQDLKGVGSGVERLGASERVGRVAGPLAELAGPERRTARKNFMAATAGWRAAAEVDLESAGFRPTLFAHSLDDLERTLRLPAAPPEPDVHWEGQDYRSLIVYPRRAFQSPEERREFRRFVLREVGAHPDQEGDRGFLTVDAAGLSDFLGPLLARDLYLALGVASTLVGVILLLAFRSMRERAAALAPVVVGLGLTFGVLVVWQFPVHPGNLLALPLILGLGIDDGIHMVLRAREDGPDALLTTGRSIWRTTLTTMLGFGSLAFANSPAIASMGILAATGALACFLATLLGTPRILGAHR